MVSKTVMVFGVFDIFHKGHEHYIKSARKHGSVIAVVARDSTVLRLKGKLPVKNERSRLAKLAALSYVHKAVLGSATDPMRVVEAQRPDVICLGYDQKSFVDILKKRFPSIKRVRISPYIPSLYKSSLLSKDR